MANRIRPTGGATIPGVRTSVANPTPPVFGMPPMSNPAVQPVPQTMPANMFGKRPYPGSSNQMISGMKSAFPPNKIPRGNNVATGEPMIVGTGSPASIGRGITPSYVVGQLGSIANRASRVKPSDTVSMFNAISRTVETEQTHHAHALYLRNQLVFLDIMASRDPKRGRLNSSSTITRVVGGWKVRMPKEITTLLSLPVLNYLLRLEDTIGNPGTSEEDWIDAAAVLRRFRFDGAVRTDAHESSNPAFRNSDIKHYTVTIDGMDADVTNIWGLLSIRQPLWLIVKRLRRDQLPQGYFISPSEGYRPVPTSTPEIEYHPQPMQIVPWSNIHKWTPNVDDLKYYDELSQTECMGIAIRVGWAREQGNAIGSRKLPRAWYDASALMDLPKVSIDVNGFRSDVPV